MCVFMSAGCNIGIIFHWPGAVSLSLLKFPLSLAAIFCTGPTRIPLTSGPGPAANIIDCCQSVSDDQEINE